RSRLDRALPPLLSFPTRRSSDLSAITITSCKNCYTIIFNCFIHYFFYTNRFFFCYEWSHISCFSLFISHSHALCLFDKLVYKLVVYRLFYKNPLHPDTVLTDSTIRPRNTTINSCIYISIF